MKTIILISAMIALSLISSAQVIQLKFTALFNGTHVDIDSVRVTNITQASDTILHWTDTTLVLGSIGIMEALNETNSEFAIRLYSANPVNDRAIIQLSVPECGKIDIKVTDVSGRILHSISRILPPGRHLYRYSPADKGASFISAYFKSECKSLKIVYLGNGGGNNELRYCGTENTTIQPKSISSSLSFIYTLGDSLQLNGWYNGNNDVKYTAPQTDSTYFFHYDMNVPCPGLSQFTYGTQVYNTVQIGTQCWMKENLNIGTFALSIQTDSSHTDVSNNGIIEKYCYDNNPANCNESGGFYDWDEMMQYNNNPGGQGICPVSWHIPTDAEWQTLFDYLGGNGVAGGYLKETGLIHWNSPNFGATNSSGFTALGTGYRDIYGVFYGLHVGALFWSSSGDGSGNANWHQLTCMYNNVNHNNNFKTLGLSVRCLKD